MWHCAQGKKRAPRNTTAVVQRSWRPPTTTGTTARQLWRHGLGSARGSDNGNRVPVCGALHGRLDDPGGVPQTYAHWQGQQHIAAGRWLVPAHAPQPAAPRPASPESASEVRMVLAMPTGIGCARSAASCMCEPHGHTAARAARRIRPTRATLSTRAHTSRESRTQQILPGSPIRSMARQQSIHTQNIDVGQYEQHHGYSNTTIQHSRRPRPIINR